MTSTRTKPRLADTAGVPLDTDKMRRLRESAGLTMDAAATAAGMTGRQAWYVVESGRKPNITLATLDAIARALGCKPADLLKAK